MNDKFLFEIKIGKAVIPVVAENPDKARVSSLKKFNSYYGGGIYQDFFDEPFDELSAEIEIIRFENLKTCKVNITPAQKTKTGIHEDVKNWGNVREFNEPVTNIRQIWELTGERISNANNKLYVYDVFTIYKERISYEFTEKAILKNEAIKLLEIREMYDINKN